MSDGLERLARLTEAAESSVNTVGALLYGSPSAIGQEAGQRIADGIMAGINRRIVKRRNHRMMAVHPWFRGEWLRRNVSKIDEWRE